MNIKYKQIILAAVIASVSFTGCNDDFVNTNPLDQVSETAVWSDAALTEAFVTEIYAGLGNGGFDEKKCDHALKRNEVGADFPR